MKRLKQLLLGGCTALLIVLSANLTNACLDSWAARDSADNYANCNLASATASSCTYVCTCWGNCANIYRMMGYRKI